MAEPAKQMATGLKPATNYRFMAVFLASMAIIINYVDRVNFGVATPSMMKEFHLSASQMGVLMSAFFWPYALMFIPAGALLNKYGSKKVMGWALMLWGLSTMLTGAVRGFTHMIFVRILLGIAEAPGFPAATRVVSVWIPLRERTFASACFDTCARVGNAFTPPFVAWIIAMWGWRMSFVVTGGLALLFCLWWFLSYKEPDEHPKVSDSELAYIRQDEVVQNGKVVSVPVPMYKLVTYPTIVKAAVGYAAYLYVWNVFTYWLPAYLMLAKGFSLKSMGFASMVPYIFAVIFELIGGVVFDKWYRRGASHTLLRRTGMGISMIGAAIFIFLTTQATTPFMMIFWLTCYCTISGFGASNVQAIPSDLAPYGQAGGVAGFIGFVGNIGALVAPMITGFLVDSRFGYTGAFILAAVVCLISATFYVFNSYDRVQPKMS